MRYLRSGAVALGVLATVLSCARNDPGTHGSEDVRASRERIALGEFQKFSAQPELRTTFVAGEPFVPVGGAFVASHRSALGPIEAVVPARASGVLRLAHPAKPDARLEIWSDDLEPVEGTLREGMVVFARAALATDVFHRMSGARVEELRLVSAPRDSIEAHYRARLGPGLALLLARERRIEAVDAKGFVHLASAPIFAVDRAGTRRDADVEVVRESGDTFLATVRIDARGMQFPVLVDPSWSSAATPYYDHSAGPNVLLKSGEVLASAASKPSVDFKLTELYAPSTNTWTIVGSFSTRRTGHGLSMMTSGKVLATGGATGSGLSSEAEIYDPSSTNWTLAANMAATRQEHTSTALSAGRVLVAGGSGGSTAEVYDEASNTWTKVGSLSLARTKHVAALLASGKVLVTGGYEGTIGALSTAEIYDPATKTWSAAASMTTARINACAITLASGKVLVASGSAAVASTVYTTAELYDPGTNSWSAAGTMAAGRTLHGCVLLKDGSALAVGGLAGSIGLSSAEIYTPSTNSWSSAPAMPSPHAAAGLTTRLNDGRVFVLDSTTALLYDPSIAPGTCVLDTDCKSTEYCAAGKCAPKVVPDAGPDGASDAGADATLDSGGDAIEDTATDTPATDTPATDGSLKKNGAVCFGDGECQSGHCADAICCDVLCDGQCQACDIKGKEGTCSLVTGAPHGVRPACGDDPTCLGKCDGVAALTCVFPPAATPCGSTCENGTESVKSCDGKGSCKPATSSSCNGAICEGPKCKTTCASNSDCMGGYACGADGKCAPASVAPAAQDSGGCGCALPGSSRSRWSFAALALCLGLSMIRQARRRHSRDSR